MEQDRGAAGEERADRRRRPQCESLGDRRQTLLQLRPAESQAAEVDRERVAESAISGARGVVAAEHHRARLVGQVSQSTQQPRLPHPGLGGDENDLRPAALPFPGLFLRCGEQQVHILELPNPDPDVASDRPSPSKDRGTAYSVKSLAPVRAALEAADIAYEMGGADTLHVRDPDANLQTFVERPDIQPIAEAFDGPMVPWTRLW